MNIRTRLFCSCHQEWDISITFLLYQNYKKVIRIIKYLCLSLSWWQWFDRVIFYSGFSKSNFYFIVKQGSYRDAGSLTTLSRWTRNPVYWLLNYQFIWKVHLCHKKYSTRQTKEDFFLLIYLNIFCLKILSTS